MNLCICSTDWSSSLYFKHMDVNYTLVTHVYSLQPPKVHVVGQWVEPEVPGEHPHKLTRTFLLLHMQIWT